MRGSLDMRKIARRGGTGSGTGNSDLVGRLRRCRTGMEAVAAAQPSKQLSMLVMLFICVCSSEAEHDPEKLQFSARSCDRTNTQCTNWRSIRCSSSSLYISTDQMAEMLLQQRTLDLAGGGDRLALEFGVEFAVENAERLDLLDPTELFVGALAPPARSACRSRDWSRATGSSCTTTSFARAHSDAVPTSSSIKTVRYFRPSPITLASLI